MKIKNILKGNKKNDEDNEIMTVDYIIERYELYQDCSCTCFQNAPCSKCVECPTEEEYREAKMYLDSQDFMRSVDQH